MTELAFNKSLSCAIKKQWQTSMSKKNWGKILSAFPSLFEEIDAQSLIEGISGITIRNTREKQVHYNQIAFYIQLPSSNYRRTNGRKRVWILCLNKLETTIFLLAIQSQKIAHFWLLRHTPGDAVVFIVNRRMSWWQWHLKKMRTASQYIGQLW